MRESRRADVVIIVSLVMIAAALAGYASLVLRWFSPPSSARATMTQTSGAAQAELEAARRGFRDDFLDPFAHLRLAEALWRAGRPIDSFYVTYAARGLFSDSDFRRAHAEAVLGAGGPAAQEAQKLAAIKDPSLAVPILEGLDIDYPDSPEARDALARLSRMACADPDGEGGPPAEAAQSALEELHKKRPKDPAPLAALGDALLERGDIAAASAFARDALAADARNAGAAHVMGAIALRDGDFDSARRWLDAAWSGNSHDLFSAEKLAQIYENRLADPSGALPFELALYRADPYADIDDNPVETRIRQILDARRKRLIDGTAPADLAEKFRLDDASLRAEAAIRSADLGQTRWIDDLGELLDDDCQIVRRAADYALFRVGKSQPEAVRARRELWLGSAEPLVRIRALNLFADLDGMNALPRAIKALEDPNPAVRAYAIAMVLDHYYAQVPEAREARARALASEKDPAVLKFVRLHEPRP